MSLHESTTLHTIFKLMLNMGLSFVNRVSTLFREAVFERARL